MIVLITTITILTIIGLILTFQIVKEWIASYRENKLFREQYKKYKAYVKQMEKARDRENNKLN